MEPLVILVALAILVVLVNVLAPSEIVVCEPFSGQIQDASGNPKPKVKSATILKNVTMPAENLEDYVAKSALVPCTCPTMTCPQHESEAYGHKNPEDFLNGPKVPHAAIRKRFAAMGRLKSSADAQPYLNDFSAFGE